jgi:hypothetical protein
LKVKYIKASARDTHKNPKTLSGIETIKQVPLSSSKMHTKTPKPYQGLKRKQAKELAIADTIVSTQKPQNPIRD